MVAVAWLLLLRQTAAAAAAALQSAFYQFRHHLHRGFNTVQILYYRKHHHLCVELPIGSAANDKKRQLRPHEKVRELPRGFTAPLAR